MHPVFICPAWRCWSLTKRIACWMSTLLTRWRRWYDYARDKDRRCCSRLPWLNRYASSVLPLSAATPPTPAFSLVDSRGISETLSTRPKSRLSISLICCRVDLVTIGTRASPHTKLGGNMICIYVSNTGFSLMHVNLVVVEWKYWTVCRGGMLKITHEVVGFDFHHLLLCSEWWNIDQTEPPHALSRSLHHGIQLNIL